MASWQPDLSWVGEDIAVGGSFPGRKAVYLAERLGIRAVVDLRSESRDDEVVLRRHGIVFLHLPVDDHCAASASQIRDGVAFAGAALDRGEKVLIHCEHGIGRSATLALCLMVARGTAPLDALEQAKRRRALVSPSPAQYECWAAFLASFARQHEVGWTVPGFDAFAAIAYRHLHPAGSA